jgi:carboxyl-terminal processing protease
MMIEKPVEGKSLFRRSRGKSRAVNRPIGGFDHYVGEPRSVQDVLRRQDTGRCSRQWDIPEKWTMLRWKTNASHRTTEVPGMAEVLASCMLALVTLFGLIASAHAQPNEVPARKRPSKTARPDESAPLVIRVDQLPREVGNRWIFQVSSPDESLDGKKHYYFFHDRLEHKGRTFLRRRAEIPGVIQRPDGLQLFQTDGWFGYWDPDDEVPYDVIKLPLASGMEWEQDVLFKTENGAKRLLWNKWQAETEETIDVPAGRFRCIRVRGFNHTLDSSDDVLVWLTPNTGLVKWMYSGEGLTGELVGFERSASLPDTKARTGAATHKKDLPAEQVEVSAAETAKLDRRIRGTLVGIGIAFEKSEEGIVIKNVLPDTPAEKAGVKAGGLITSIEGLSTESMTSDQAVKLILGPVGTKVELSVLPPGASTPHRVVLTRERIVLSNATSRMLEKDIGLLAITGFNQRTPKAVRKALREFRQANVRGLVVDLRDNVGGYYPAAVEIASMLVGENQPLWQLQEIGEQDRTRVRGQQYSALRFPKVALISARTRSGGELLASALKASGKATLLGQKTAGKGTMGERKRRPDGTSVRIMTAYLFTANGEPIDGHGIIPDREIDPDASTEDVLKMAIDELCGEGE